MPADLPIPMLLGPTASGKSAVALALAERMPIEIVTVDSAQVYRGMDIGTAKPSHEDRRRVAHHLVDLVDPAERYSAARFVDDAQAAIAAIRSRGRVPMLVGGTMLYARALVEGLHPLPAGDPALRRRLDEEARALGWPAMHARLAKADPRSAARIEPGDAQRVQRALEIVELTGRPLSQWLEEPRHAEDARSRSAERFVRIALEPSDRSVLHARIASRFRSMIDAGFLDEVRALRARGDLSTQLPSMRCVGYRQAWIWLDAQARGESQGLDTLVEAGIAATRQLAKRQLTWLRAIPDRVVVDCLAPDAIERTFDALRDRAAP